MIFDVAIDLFSDCVQGLIEYKRSDAACPLCKQKVTKRNLKSNDMMSNLTTSLAAVIKAFKEDIDGFVEPEKLPEYRHSPELDLSQMFPEPEKKCEVRALRKQIAHNRVLRSSNLALPQNSTRSPPGSCSPAAKSGCLSRKPSCTLSLSWETKSIPCIEEDRGIEDGDKKIESAGVTVSESNAPCSADEGKVAASKLVPVVAIDSKELECCNSSEDFVHVMRECKENGERGLKGNEDSRKESPVGTLSVVENNYVDIVKVVNSSSSSSHASERENSEVGAVNEIIASVDIVESPLPSNGSLDTNEKFENGNIKLINDKTPDLYEPGRNKARSAPPPDSPPILSSSSRGREVCNSDELPGSPCLFEPKPPMACSKSSVHTSSPFKTPIGLEQRISQASSRTPTTDDINAIRAEVEGMEHCLVDLQKTLSRWIAKMKRVLK